MPWDAKIKLYAAIWLITSMLHRFIEFLAFEYKDFRGMKGHDKTRLLVDCLSMLKPVPESMIFTESLLAILK